MKHAALALLCWLFLCSAQAQKVKEIDIQEIALQDTFLLRQVEQFIENKYAEPDGLFKSGLGYIEIYLQQMSKEDTLRTYHLNSQYKSLDQERALYPSFYTFVRNRLVLIHVPGLQELLVPGYTEKSKRELRKKLEPFLPKAETLKIKNEQGKVVHVDKKFRSGEKLQLHGGKTIYILKSGPPVVVRNVY